jgi:predicted transcriptional regulator
MATIIIETTAEEQRKVIEAISKLAGQTVAYSKLAKEAKVPENRVRYVVTDLLESGKITRTATKAMSKHYVRYMYDVVR